MDKQSTGQRLADAIKRSADWRGTSHFTEHQKAARDELVSIARARMRKIGEIDDSALVRLVDEIAPDPLPVARPSAAARAALASGLEWDMDSPALWERVDDKTRIPARSEILGRFARGTLGDVERKYKVAFMPPDVLAIREELRQVLEGERQRALSSKPKQTTLRKHDIKLLMGADGKLLERVNFAVAEQYGGIKPRQRLNLMESGALEKTGSGRLITVKSLLEHWPPEKDPH